MFVWFNIIGIYKLRKNEDGIIFGKFIFLVFFLGVLGILVLKEILVTIKIFFYR